MECPMNLAIYVIISIDFSGILWTLFLIPKSFFFLNIGHFEEVCGKYGDKIVLLIHEYMCHYYIVSIFYLDYSPIFYLLKNIT